MATATFNGKTGIVWPMTLKREWFNRILEGKKKIEYRSGSEYWQNRFSGTVPTFIRFANGYGAKVPAFTVEVLGVRAMCGGDFDEAEMAATYETDFTDGTVALDSKDYEKENTDWYEIKLGKIVKKENIK